MNNIFKVIWNHSTQRLVVVSELARNHTKVSSTSDVESPSSSKVTLKAGLAALLIGIGVNVYGADSSIGVSIGGAKDNTVISDGAQGGSPGKYTQALNYFNPGSKSYDDKDVGPTNEIRYYNRPEMKAMGIAIGHNTTARNNQFANGVAIGDHSQATGGLSVAVGSFSKSVNTGAVALGTAALAHGFNSFSAMRQSAAIGDYSAAIGSVAWANGKASVALGASATAKGRQSFAIGSADPVTLEGYGTEVNRTKYDGNNNTQANGDRSFAIGTSAKTNGNDSFALGSDAQAGKFISQQDDYLKEAVTAPDANGVAKQAIAFGTKSRALGNDSVAFSTTANASANESIAFGVNANSSAERAISFGVNTTANGSGSAAFGSLAKSSGENAIAFGVQSQSEGVGATAVGVTSKAIGNNSIAIGLSANSTAEKVVAIGASSVASKVGGIAIGENASTTAVNSITIGLKSNVTGENATAIGTESSVSGTNGTALGRSANASAHGALASGYQAKASGVNATAIGYNTSASGVDAIAIGSESKTSGNTSGTLGKNNNVSGANTFAVGNNITATAANNVILGANSSEASTTTTAGKANQITTATVGTLTYSGFQGTASGIVSVGANGSERQLINVAPGKISADSTDAINGSQLYATNKNLDNLANSVKSNFGGNANLTSDGNITFTNIGETGKDNIHDAIKAAKTEVAAGSNIAGVITTTGANGQKIYTVHANGTSVTNGSDKIVVSPNSVANNVTNYAVDLSRAAKDSLNKADTALQSWVAKVNSANVKTVTKDDNTLNFVNGNNIEITKSGSDIKVATSKDVTFDNVSVGPVVINKDSGINAGDKKVANVSNGTISADSKDAVNGSQLYATNQNVTNLTNFVDGGLNFTGNKGSAFNKKLGQTLAVKGGLANDAEASSKNVRVDSENGELIVKIADKPEFKDVTLKDGDNVVNFTTSQPNTLTLGGKDNAPVTVNNVKGNLTPTYNQGNKVIGEDGKPTTNVSTAPTKSQTGPSAEEAAKLYNNAATVGDVLSAGWNLQNNGEAKDFVKPYDTVNFVNGGNTQAVVVTDAKGQVSNVSVNVVGLPVQYTTVDGTPVVKVGDSYYKVGQDGKPDLTQKVDGNNLVTNLINPNAKPNEKGSEVTLGNVKSSVEDKAGDTYLNKLTNASAANPNNAVNVKDLNDTVTAITDPTQGGGFGLKDDQGNEVKQGLGKTVSVIGDGAVLTKVVDQADGSKALKVSLNSTTTIGDDKNPGTITVKGENGKDGVSINGKDGTIGLTGPAGKDGAPGASATIGVKDSAKGIDGNNGKDGESKTRIVYETKNPDGTTNTEEVATLNDGLYFAGNQGDVIAKKLNNTLSVKGGLANDKAASAKNVRVDSENGELIVKIAETPEFKGVDIKSGNTTTSITNNDAGDLKVAGNNGAPVKITNVKAGTDDTDAVNVSQLKGAVNNINNKMNKQNKANRAGIAGSNAAAALPQVYIPGKSMVAAAAGTFKGQSAVAVGYSRASDNGKVILKLQGNANTQGDIGAGVGVGYQW